MKSIYLTLFLSFVLGNSAQAQCNCTTDVKNNNGTVATRILILSNGHGKSLSFRCVSVRREYYNNEQGQEVEKSVIDCISKKSINLRLAPDFRYYSSGIQDEKIAISELQKRFFAKAKADPYKFYQLDFNESKQIIMISEYYLPVKEKK
ncbi:hypothetical protein LL912_02965 [Niabella sp. CC-SYL272]|uniref:hypothetical protein n=1 Tax=Niabella agricola TaxID=2891571 RepID=UPI001F43F832|nr:hypothetical protein [Niabella agricola]MCF3107734.1 hypothetical protein [Niabella agricola]